MYRYERRIPFVSVCVRIFLCPTFNFGVEFCFSCPSSDENCVKFYFLLQRSVKCDRDLPQNHQENHSTLNE